MGKKQVHIARTLMIIITFVISRNIAFEESPESNCSSFIGDVARNLVKKQTGSKDLKLKN